MAKTLLVTLAIGKKYNFFYKTFFAKNHNDYAKKYQYDIIVIDTFLDKKNQQAHFIFLQKLLVCSQKFSQKYDTIIYIDADILFNIRTATPIHLLAKNDKIYIANEYSQPTPKIRLQIQKLNDWEKSATDYYKLYGFNLRTNAVLNVGFIVFNPAIHKQILENIYSKFLKIAFNNPEKKHTFRTHFEQAMIGYELQKNKLWEVLPNEWNAIWLLQKMSPGNSMSLCDFYGKNKAIHFCTGQDVHLIPKLLSS